MRRRTEEARDKALLQIFVGEMALRREDLSRNDIAVAAAQATVIFNRAVAQMDDELSDKFHSDSKMYTNGLFNIMNYALETCFPESGVSHMHPQHVMNRNRATD